MEMLTILTAIEPTSRKPIVQHLGMPRTALRATWMIARFMNSIYGHGTMLLKKAWDPSCVL